MGKRTLENVLHLKWVRELTYRDIKDRPEFSFHKPLVDKAKSLVEKIDAELKEYELFDLQKETMILKEYESGLKSLKKRQMDMQILANCLFCLNQYDKNEELQEKSHDVKILPDYWCRVENKPVDSIMLEQGGICLNYRNSGCQAEEVSQELRENEIKIAGQMVEEQRKKLDSVRMRLEKFNWQKYSRM